MKKLLMMAATVLLFSATPAKGETEVSYSGYYAEVLRVVDGDTLDVRMHIFPNLTMTGRIRLLDVDTPELRGKCKAEKELARKAKEEVIRVLPVGPTESADDMVYVVVRDIDSFGRYLAHVYARGLDVPLGRYLILKELAVEYGEESDWCSDGN